MELAYFTKTVRIRFLLLKRFDLQNRAGREHFLSLRQMLPVRHNRRRAQNLLYLQMTLGRQHGVNQCIEGSRVDDTEKRRQRVRVLFHENDHRLSSFGIAQKAASCAAAQIKKSGAAVRPPIVAYSDRIRILSGGSLQIFQYIGHSILHLSIYHE